MVRTGVYSSLVAAVLLSSSALAADLPARLPEAPPVPVPVFTWAGYYVGLNAGANFNTPRRSFTPRTFPEVVTVYTPKQDDVGFTGGAQVGANWQFNTFVVGLEGDINYLDRSNNRAKAPAAPSFPYALVTADSRAEWFATARARFGVAFDRTLLYVTGGLALTEQTDDTIRFFNLAPPGALLNCIAGCTFRSRGSGLELGWAAGGGVEYAFTDKLSVKLEYLHVDFGHDNRTDRVNVAGAPFFRAGERNELDVVRAGVNFRF